MQIMHADTKAHNTHDVQLHTASKFPKLLGIRSHFTVETYYKKLKEGLIHQINQPQKPTTNN